MQINEIYETGSETIENIKETAKPMLKVATDKSVQNNTEEAGKGYNASVIIIEYSYSDMGKTKTAKTDAYFYAVEETISDLKKNNKDFKLISQTTK